MRIRGLDPITFAALGLVVMPYILFEHWVGSGWGVAMIFVLLGALWWASRKAHRSCQGWKAQKQQWEITSRAWSSKQRWIEAALARATYGIKGASACEGAIVAMALSLVANFVLCRLELLSAASRMPVIDALNDGLWFLGILSLAGSFVLYARASYKLISAIRLRKRLSLDVD